MKIHNKLDLGHFPSSSSCLPHPFPDGGYQPAQARDRSSLSAEGGSLSAKSFVSPRGFTPYTHPQISALQISQSQLSWQETGLNLK